MARPGQSTRAGVTEMKFAPSKSSRPQVGKSGGKPRPRKERADSTMIALAMPKVAETMIGLSTLGRMWRVMMRRRRVPMLRAAVTNARSRSASTSPRTMRAVCIQLVMPMTNTTSRKIPVSGPKAARRLSRKSMMTTSSSGSSGSARNMSVPRISRPSSGLK